MVGTAGGGERQLAEPLLEGLAHGRMGDDCGTVGVGRVAGEGAAGLDFRKDQGADVVAVEAAEHDVADQRRAGGDDAGADACHVDPGAGR